MLDWLLWITVGVIVVHRRTVKKHKSYQKFYEQMRKERDFLSMSDNGVIRYISFTLTVATILWPLVLIRSLIKDKE